MFSVGGTIAAGALFSCETTEPSPNMWRVVKCLTLKKKRQQLIELCETALENDLAEQRSGYGPCLYLVVVSCENYRSVQIKQG